MSFSTPFCKGYIPSYISISRMSDNGPTYDSIAKTTFQGLTPCGASCLLEMLVMGFGLCNAPATFTRLITNVLDPFIYLFVIAYLDAM
jgi:hypothetical protein